VVWLKWIGLALVLLVLIDAGVTAYGAAHWDKATRALIARLEAARVAPDVARYDRHELDSLPPPVQRYFRAVLKNGQPVVSAVSLTHRGTFNTSAAEEQWKHFRSTQRVAIHRPGFVWDARVAMVPGLAVMVHDAYVAGEGVLQPAILGLFSLAGQRGSGEIARGELMRFLAETAWYPTALLPSQGVRWEPIDDQSARATLVDANVRVALAFRFNDQDLIDSVQADARGRTVGDRTEQLPWHGRFWNYAERDGMRVPLDGEVAWLTPAGRKPYWRGTIESIDYEFAR
jgi:hypothetical protein